MADPGFLEGEGWGGGGGGGGVWGSAADLTERYGNNRRQNRLSGWFCSIS